MLDIDGQGFQNRTIFMDIICVSFLIEIALRHVCSSLNLLHIFRTSFYENSCGGTASAVVFKILSYIYDGSSRK